MTLDPVLRKFNVQAFEPIHQEMIALEEEINIYQAQKKKTNNLAIVFFATFVFFTLKIAWNKLTGTDFIVAASSSSSLILCLFDIALGGITLMFRMIENTKAQQFAQRISTLVQKTTRKFYGDRTEQHPDSATPPVVLESIQSNLKPHFKDSVPLETGYILIATHEVTVEGDSADNFDWSSKKITDNFEEVKATIGKWRQDYYDRYVAEQDSRNSATMQFIASKCIQGLPTIMIEYPQVIASKCIQGLPTIVIEHASSVVRIFSPILIIEHYKPLLPPG